MEVSQHNHLKIAKQLCGKLWCYVPHINGQIMAVVGNQSEGILVPLHWFRGRSKQSTIAECNRLNIKHLDIDAAFANKIHVSAMTAHNHERAA